MMRALLVPILHAFLLGMAAVFVMLAITGCARRDESAYWGAVSRQLGNELERK